jgi:hypothetical protein
MSRNRNRQNQDATETPDAAAADDPVNAAAESTVADAPTAETPDAPDAPDASCPVRGSAGFANIHVSEPSARWLSLLYHDGDGKTVAPTVKRFAWRDDDGTVHVAVIRRDDDGTIIPSSSKHWRVPNVVTMPTTAPLPMQSGVNWVDRAKVEQARLLVTTDDADDAPGKNGAIVFRCSDGKGGTVVRSYNVTVLS